MVMLFDSCKETTERPNSIPVNPILHPTVTPTQCAPSNCPPPSQYPLMSSTLPNYRCCKEQRRLWLVPHYTGWLDSRLRGEELLKHSLGPLFYPLIHKTNFIKLLGNWIIKVVSLSNQRRIDKLTAWLQQSSLPGNQTSTIPISLL